MVPLNRLEENLPAFICSSASVENSFQDNPARESGNKIRRLRKKFGPFVKCHFLYYLIKMRLRLKSISAKISENSS
jgi:hypothetical protein